MAASLVKPSPTTPSMIIYTEKHTPSDQYFPLTATKPCYPQACYKLFQQVVTSLQKVSYTSLISAD